MARSIDRKLQLARSFIELLDELPIEQINVTMVAQRSGLSRQTFYYHFRCIEDLTNWTAHQVILRTVAPYRDSSWQVWLRAVLDMLYANRSLVLKVAAEDGRDSSIKVFKEEIGLLIMRIVEDADRRRHAREARSADRARGNAARELLVAASAFRELSAMLPSVLF